MTIIRNFIFLIIFIVLAFFGLRHSLYGLFVSFMGADLVELSMADINTEHLKYNRHIEIEDAFSIDAPLKYTAENNKVTHYLYILLAEAEYENTTKSLRSNIILESTKEIKDWSTYQAKGLLKPHWYYIDQEVIDGFGVAGFEIDENGYYLVADEKPWKWYWYVILILVVILFVYRLVEAIVKGLRKHRSKERDTDFKSEME